MLRPLQLCQIGFVGGTRIRQTSFDGLFFQALSERLLTPNAEAIVKLGKLA